MDEVNKNVARGPKYNRNFHHGTDHHEVHKDWRNEMNRPDYNRPSYGYNSPEYCLSRGFERHRIHSSDRNYQHPSNRNYHHRPSDRNYWHSNEKWHAKKQPSRPNSPVEEGTEEYMNKKIQQTSAIIMRQLLSPEENIIPLKNANESTTKESRLGDTETNSESRTKRKRKENTNEAECSNSNKHKKNSSYNIDGIPDKLMSYLSNLNEGRKKNLISNTTTVYDDAINTILKQKRLEKSRDLRSVSKSSDVTESTDWINSIIPDMGIKIEDFPELLLLLQNRLSENSEDFTDLNYSAETVANTPNADRIEEIKDDDTFEKSADDNVVPTATQDIVEIIQSDVLIRTPSYLDLNDPEFSINDAVNVQTPPNFNEAASQCDTSIRDVEVDVTSHKSSSHLGAVPCSDLEARPSHFESGTCLTRIDATTCSTQFGTSSKDAEAEVTSLRIERESSSHSGAIPYSNSESCSSHIKTGACSSQLDARTSSTLAEAGTCSTGISAGTSSIQIDTGTCSTSFELVQRCEENLSPITISDESDDEAGSNVDKRMNLGDEILMSIRNKFSSEPSTYALAIKRMFFIDKLIAQLTQYRQDIFANIRTKKAEKKKKKLLSLREAEIAQPIGIPQQPRIAQPTGIAQPRQITKSTKITQPTNKAQPVKKGKKAKNPKPTTKITKKAKNSKPTKSNKTVKGSKSTKAANQAKTVKKKEPKKMKNKQKTDTNVLLTTLAIQAVSVPEQIQEVPVKDDSKEVDWSIDTVGIVHEECMIKDEIKLDNDVVTVKEEPESDDFDIVDVVPQTLTNKGPILEFDDLKEKVLVLKVCKDKLVMATESGEIYIYNITTGTREATVKVTKLPITSLVFKKFRDSKPYLFVGSCESSLKVYNLYSTFLLRSFYLEDSVQCMDEKWGYLFLGCLRGTIIRYSIKKEQLEHQEQFSSNPVLVLRATVEGARKVLLIGSRDSPVIVRDAMNGLLLRKLNIIYPTVYSMVTHNHYVICGTKACDILLFNFHNGNLEHTFKATAAKGVACMKVVGKCLFASCYNGNIYVFNLETKTLVDKMCGPGGVIISMEVLTHQVIVGTLSFKIGSIPITQTVLSQMR